ncbi:ARMADILLO BTB ARABIDOPSIS PROTEIN 1-like [Zerene cesonia]|uniref:ARMADILLO BTB ARABIDOPSIS PROTEIN 1-like n=1 Tax=Zerene cesonia TaxID=33412 RepID=UPI0018E4F2B2|nr:ARMADILLO BTB ARABIDOPSIS PROTEIN 1-like [Zerene cesonia]
MEKNKLDFVMDNYVIHGHQPCQTSEAKYLCLDAIYEKCHRPNFYDIGGTYIHDIPDFWFIFKTEQVADLYLVHIFMTNKQEGSINVQISNSNSLSFDKEKNIAFLSSNLSKLQFDKVQESSQKYLTTFCFEKFELDLMKGKQLFITISFFEDEGKTTVDRPKQVLDFGSLLDDPIGADFVIESEDGEKFQVHKLLLTAHSEVFRAMLKEDTAETKNGWVKLIEVGKEDLQHLLTFIYTGTLKNLDDINFFNMLILADRFNLEGLRELSEHALIQQLSIDNALEMLAVADSYNSQALKTGSLLFIKKNMSTLDNSIFEELHNAALVRELCKYLVS